MFYGKSSDNFTAMTVLILRLFPLSDPMAVQFEFRIGINYRMPSLWLWVGLTVTSAYQGALEQSQAPTSLRSKVILCSKLFFGLQVDRIVSFFSEYTQLSFRGPRAVEGCLTCIGINNVTKLAATDRPRNHRWGAWTTPQAANNRASCVPTMSRWPKIQLKRKSQNTKEDLYDDEGSGSRSSYGYGLLSSVFIFSISG